MRPTSREEWLKIRFGIGEGGGLGHGPMLGAESTSDGGSSIEAGLSREQRRYVRRGSSASVLFAEKTPQLSNKVQNVPIEDDDCCTEDDVCGRIVLENTCDEER